jgi:hypothetical protein
MSERGKIHNRERARQIVDFSGLRYTNKTPTDIDGFVDYKNKVFVWFELKYNGTDILPGQRLALERLVDASNVKSYALIADHYVDNPQNDVEAHAAIVREYYDGTKWRPPKESISIRQALNKLLGEDALVKGREICPVCEFELDENGRCGVCDAFERSGSN